MWVLDILILLFLLFLINKTFNLQETLDIINSRTQTIKMKANEAIALLTETKATLERVAAESATLLQKIIDLQTAAENETDLSPEFVAALQDVATQARVVDDLVPNGPSVEPPAEPAPEQPPANPDQPTT